MPKSSTAPALAMPALAALVAVASMSSPHRSATRADGTGVGAGERSARSIQHTEPPTSSIVQLVTLSPSSKATGAAVIDPPPTGDGGEGEGGGLGVVGGAVVGNVVAKAFNELPVALMVGPAESACEVVVGILVGAADDGAAGTAVGLATGVTKNNGKVGADDANGTEDGSGDGPNADGLADTVGAEAGTSEYTAPDLGVGASLGVTVGAETFAGL